MSRAHGSRVYGEPVNVQARDDGRPARFVWWGRLYTVRAILEHWIISREWWQDAGAPGPEPGQLELEFWRVEASPGQGMAAAVYELRREAASGGWLLRPHLAHLAPDPRHGRGFRLRCSPKHASLSRGVINPDTASRAHGRNWCNYLFPLFNTTVMQARIIMPAR